MGNTSQEEYDRVSTEFAELYEEYCAESDRLFFEFQERARYLQRLEDDAADSYDRY